MTPQRPLDAFAKMRAGRARIEAIARKQAERKAENDRLIWKQQEASRQRAEIAKHYQDWCKVQSEVWKARGEAAARRAEAKRWKWWWQK